MKNIRHDARQMEDQTDPAVRKKVAAFHTRHRKPGYKQQNVPVTLTVVNSSRFRSSQVGVTLGYPSNEAEHIVVTRKGWTDRAVN